MHLPKATKDRLFHKDVVNLVHNKHSIIICFKESLKNMPYSYSQPHNQITQASFVLMQPKANISFNGKENMLFIEFIQRFVSSSSWSVNQTVPAENDVSQTPLANSWCIQSIYSYWMHFIHSIIYKRCQLMKGPKFSSKDKPNLVRKIYDVLFSPPFAGQWDSSCRTEGQGMTL